MLWPENGWIHLDSKWLDTFFEASSAHVPLEVMLWFEKKSILGRVPLTSAERVHHNLWWIIWGLVVNLVELPFNFYLWFDYFGGRTLKLVWALRIRPQLKALQDLWALPVCFPGWFFSLVWTEFASSWKRSDAVCDCFLWGCWGPLPNLRHPIRWHSRPQCATRDALTSSDLFNHSCWSFSATWMILMWL